MPTKVPADSLLCTSQFLRICEGNNWGERSCCILISWRDMRGLMGKMYTPHSGPQDFVTQSTRQVSCMLCPGQLLVSQVLRD